MINYNRSYFKSFTVFSIMTYTGGRISGEGEGGTFDLILSGKTTKSPLKYLTK